MTEACKPEAETDKPAVSDPGTPWARLLLVLSILGGGFAWLVGNFTDVAPVLEHPFMMFTWTWVCFMLGGAAVYTLIARPLEQRFSRAEDVIRRLRDRERQLLIEQGNLKAEVASLKSTVDHLKEQVEQLMAKRPATARTRKKSD